MKNRARDRVLILTPYKRPPKCQILHNYFCSNRKQFVAWQEFYAHFLLEGEYSNQMWSHGLSGRCFRTGGIMNLALAVHVVIFSRTVAPLTLVSRPDSPAYQITCREVVWPNSATSTELPAPLVLICCSPERYQHPSRDRNPLQTIWNPPPARWQRKSCRYNCPWWVKQWSCQYQPVHPEEVAQWPRQASHLVILDTSAQRYWTQCVSSWHRTRASAKRPRMYKSVDQAFYITSFPGHSPGHSTENKSRASPSEMFFMYTGLMTLVIALFVAVNWRFKRPYS